MSVVSYVFVVRGLEHTHDGDGGRTCKPAAPAASGKAIVSGLHRVDRRGTATRLYVDPAGHGARRDGAGHWHEVTVDSSAGRPELHVGRPGGNAPGPRAGLRQAPFPRHQRGPTRRRESTSATSGCTAASSREAARPRRSGRSSNITEDRFPDGLPVEMNIEVFRTYKGDIEKGVLGSLSLRNPQHRPDRRGGDLRVEGLRDAAVARAAEDHQVLQRQTWSQRKIDTPRRRGVHAAQSARQVAWPSRRSSTCSRTWWPTARWSSGCAAWSRRSTSGPARPTCICAPPTPRSASTFFKGYLGIWLQMVLVIGFGVMFSTFLSGPVAMIATLGALVGGFFSDFLAQLSRQRGPRRRSVRVDHPPGDARRT